MDIDNVRAYALSGHSAPSADNSQPWHFYWRNSELSIAYDKERIEGVTFSAWSPATLLSIGGVIENMAQAADRSGVAFEIELLPGDSAIPDCYVRICLPRTGGKTANPDLSPLLQRHTNRFAFRKEPVSPDTLDPVRRLSENDARISMFSGTKPVDSLARLVHSATEVRFQTQEIHEWLGKSLRFSRKDVEKADGLDVATFDLPPGGRQFLKFISDWRHIRVLNRIGIYKVLAGIDTAPFKKAPTIVAITGSQGDKGALDAGRLLTRAWIQLNSEGVAVHPYYVVPDQIFRLRENSVPNHLTGQVKDIEAQVKDIFNLEQARDLYMLLRIGYPTHKAPRSRRIPLDEVFTNLGK